MTLAGKVVPSSVDERHFRRMLDDVVVGDEVAVRA